jgi:hypothetical protein
VTGNIECEAGESDAVCLSNGGLAVLSAVSPDERRHGARSFLSGLNTKSDRFQPLLILKRFWSVSEIDFYLRITSEDISRSQANANVQRPETSVA